jgi:hypothetical protein
MFSLDDDNVPYANSSSCPQIFVGTPQTIYFVDKAENNPTQINGHPAWASGTCSSQLSFRNPAKHIFLAW